MKIIIHKMRSHFPFSAYKGFTLVEIVVSIALFGFVVVALTGAMLVVVDGNRKSKSLINAVDGLNFALESMAREIRVGDFYNCVTPIRSGFTGDCPNGDTTMGFISSDGAFIVYRLNTNTNRIQRCGSAFLPCPNLPPWGTRDDSMTSTNYVDMTGSDLTITDLTFYVLGSSNLDNQQPRAAIAVKGVAGVGETSSEFFVQTTITQRFPDI
jgi:prepilin-type N-terminal cleavage/methylation domain-containing protein